MCLRYQEMLREQEIAIERKDCGLNKKRVRKRYRERERSQKRNRESAIEEV